MKTSILKLRNLSAKTGTIEILKNINLEIKKNEIHAIMGPNGSGKSTLAKVLAGHPYYTVTQGSINFLGKNILKMSPEKRSHEGLFLGFQYPLEIRGITNNEFLRIIYNEKRKFNRKNELSPLLFTMFLQKLLKKLDIKNSFLYRDINSGFSGGEKKRNEILQMLLLKPKLAILDEIDSGVDIDALKSISKIILELKKKYVKFSALIITHYPKLLHYIKPNYVHIMINGHLVYTGNNQIIKYIDKYGYNIFIDK